MKIGNLLRISVLCKKRGGVILLLFLALVYSESKTKFYSLKLNNIIDMGVDSEADKYALLGWTNCLQKLDYRADVVFFGNSITRGSDFSQYFDSIKICNLGYSGDNLDAMIKRMDMIRAVKPKKIFVMAGINKLQWYNMSQFEAKYNRLIDSLSSAAPAADMYLQSILPHAKKCAGNLASNAKIQEANKIISKIANERKLKFIDLFSLYYDGEYMPQELTKDGVHLKEKSYDIWANKIRNYVYE